MEENKYLNEEQYQKNAKKLKTIAKLLLIIGICILILGFILLILGFISFGNTGMSIASNTTIDPTQTAQGAFGSLGIFALGGFLDTFGFIITAVGGVLLLIAHKREITAFTAQQVIPVAKEGINEMSPTIGNAAGEIAKGIKKGLNEANEEEK